MRNTLLSVSVALMVWGCASPKKSETMVPPTNPPSQEASQKVVQTTAKAEVQPIQKRAANGKVVLCKNGVDERSVTNSKFDVIPSSVEERKCEVEYKKFGNSEVVAYAHHQLEYCEEVAAKIRQNLEGAGFQCE